MGIETDFENWMKAVEDKKPSTSKDYKASINIISKHYSNKKNITVDLYDKPDINFIKKLIQVYDTGGEFAEYGNISHRTYINALKAYLRFLEYKKSENSINKYEEDKKIIKAQLIKKSSITKNSLENFTELIKKYPYPIVTKYLIIFLKNILPQISNDWWNKTVKAFLLDDEIRKISKNNDLDGLDLSPLLNILIQNWDNISKKCNFSYEDRDWVFNMKKVRNHIAHLSKKRYKDLNDIYLDFEYIGRFLELIDIEQDNIKIVIKELKNEKIEIIRDILNGG